MTINANVFSSAGRRTMLPVSLPDGATVQHALEAAGEAVPANCEVYMNGAPVTNPGQTQLPPGAGHVNITINQKTKGNERRFGGPIAMKLIWLLGD